MSKKEPEPSTLEDPLEDFSRWWSPSGRDPESGADIGGHPDAERIWARKDPGRWVRRIYGIPARIAWNAQCYRSEYLRWIEVGQLPQDDFIGLAASWERQKQSWSDLKPIIDKIGKPMPKLPKIPDYHKIEA